MKWFFLDLVMPSLSAESFQPVSTPVPVVTSSLANDGTMSTALASEPSAVTSSLAIDDLQNASKPLHVSTSECKEDKPKKLLQNPLKTFN